MKHFLSFCNLYSKNHGLKSNIGFTYSYSPKKVNFLDTSVTLENDGTLSTNLYCKPASVHQYLNKQSCHPPHTITAIPKSQFIRIRRICTHLDDYSKNATLFIKIFLQRGYKPKYLKQISEEVAKMNRDELLETRNKPKSDRIPFVITWHHHLKDLPFIVQRAYSKTAEKHPEFTETFKKPPMLAFRRPRNLFSHLVHSKYVESKKYINVTKTRSFIENCMRRTDTIINSQNNRQCKIQGGSANDQGVIYAAECTKHSLIYTGQTGDKLSNRFNRHRSDIKCYPTQCELSKHFNENDCLFEKDLAVYILEKVDGPESLRLFKEDKWIMRLDTSAPNGLNIHLNDLGNLYKSLFD